MSEKHFSVMRDETIKYLNIDPNGIYVDLTLGRGGHSAEILKHLTTGKLIAFDKDINAIEESGKCLSNVSSNFQLIHADFKNFKYELNKIGIKVVDGIIADIGVSSPQLDDAKRGFSYNKNARLDMRMDQTQELDAHKIINEWIELDLINIFKNYADVMLPKKVAKGIINNRPINTTLELVKVIRASLPAPVVRKKNPSKAIFQAIRIAVNEELEALKKLLEDAPNLLKKNGVLSIITFHSIEDRIVKHSFKKFIEDKTGKLPIIIEKKWVVKQKKPSKVELEINNRSRTAKLRVLIKKGL